MNQKKCIIYGKHSCFEAIKNINRKIISIFIIEYESQKSKKEIEKIINLRNDKNNIEIYILNKNKFHDILFQKFKQIYNYKKNISDQINHQNIFIEAESLKETNLFEFLNEAENQEYNKIVILDHVIDILNIGSIIRTCVAFNVDLLIMTKDHCPDFNHHSINKIASGALEKINISIVTNLSQTIDLLKKKKYWIYGLSLDHVNKKSIYNINFDKKSVLIMGSEGNGLRKLTNEKIDFAVYIPISNNIESLNVSSALSISLYELNRLN
jgi:23S rRNA (guanosine2251-2'-O)-methyltransferase